MPLLPLIGHTKARQRLAQAVRAGRVPQVLLLSGPSGVGKQRLAVWFAQLLYCERADSEPCGGCRPCKLVGSLSHSDLHWIIPIPRPKASDPDRQTQEAAEAIAQVVADRRTQPLYAPPEGMAFHSIAAVRLIQREAALTSVEGGRRVFVVGDADRLVPQESSQEPANALLKLLEEPPANCYFVLTTTDARRLLPTIRSRAVPLRLGHLSDAEVRGFLEAYLRPLPSAAELDARVAMGRGAIGAALASGEETTKARQAATLLLEAVLSGPGPSFERALRQNPWAARGDFAAMLDALADALGEAARGAVGAPSRRQPPAVRLQDRRPDQLLRAMERVAAAREAAWGNVNPQLLLAVLGEELAETL